MFALRTDRSVACAKDLLDGMLLESETTVVSIGNEFQGLAEDVDSLLCMAASTLDSIDQGGVTKIPAKVESLVSASDQFIRKRFAATSAVLAAVKEEEKLLERFSRLNSGIRSVAKETRMLGLLTGIEAGRLGPAGLKFQYLTGELLSFAENAAQNSMEIDDQTTRRQAAMKNSWRKLAAALPCIQSEFERIDTRFMESLSVVERSVGELAACPAHFHSCLESVAGQIAGVVSAIQSYDITRQQVEHVRDVLDKFSQAAQGEATMELYKAAIGLTIQTFQLKNVKEAMESWIAQIDECLRGLLGVSCSELAKIGPLVLRQEQFLESQVVLIKDLEQECEKDSGEVEMALLDLSNLMKMIAENFKNSRVIRDRMQLLSFNSRIEANNCGSEGVVMVEISKNITRVASEWREMTERSERTMEEMSSLVVQAKEGMRALCHGGDDGLEAAQAEINEVLSKLKGAAAGTSGNASQIAATVSGLQAKIESIRSKAPMLNRLVLRVEEAMDQVEGVRRKIESESPGPEMPSISREELEKEYSAHYTTEIERQLLRAALFGDPMPTAQAVAGGNDVELF